MPLFSKPTVDWIIVGLGNPGAQYASTRHNTGFMTLDLLASRLQVKVSREKFKALTCPASFEGKKLLLLAPQTFMNASGISVEAAAHFYRVPPERILVVYDDVSLPIGRIRIRKDGSAGGHNGIRSIISMLGTETFPRVRVGVGEKPHPDYDLADWVLSTVSKADQPSYRSAMEHAAEAALCVVSEGCDRAAAQFNGQHY